MAYKILTKNGVNNSNIDGARDCYFNTGMRDGIVKGAFNEGTFASNSSNSVYLDTCELRISGHRILIDEAIYQTFSNRPSVDKRYSFIAQIVVDDSSNVSFSIIIQDANTNLIKNNLYSNENGSGTYQVEIGRFTQLTDGTITDVIRTIDIITGNGNIDVDYIRIGQVITNMLETSFDAEVDIENVINENTGLKETNFTFSIPKSAGSVINVGGEQVDSVNFTSDPQTQISTLSTDKLDTTIASNTYATITALSTETTNRQSSDTNLQTQITACVNDIDDLKTTDTTLQNDINTRAKSDASNLNDSNILSWQNKLNNMTTLTEGQTQSGRQATVVDSYLSSDGLTWYRIWSDGWKECGGTTYFGSSISLIPITQIVLPLSFRDNKFKIFPVINWNGASSVEGINGAHSIHTFNAQSNYPSNSTVNLRIQFGNSGSGNSCDRPLSYYACGY